MSAIAVTIGDLMDMAITAIKNSEQSLRDKLDTITTGDEVTNMDLLSYQMELAANSLTASTCSAIAKERSETLKSVVQKF